MSRAWIVLAAGLALGGTAVACTKQDASPPVTATEDRPALDAIVASDMAIERLLKQADDLSADGKDDEAVNALEKVALPAIDAALVSARGTKVGSAWGIARRDEWVALFGDRRAETVRYSAAIKDGELEGRIAAMQAQVALTKRAIAAAKAVQAGPS